ncbi:hypothetical protein KM176_24100 [Pseudooceanicola sp. CBS1P-1]|nr:MULTISPECIES: hypothetical protein [Pseudooceanicola]MBT9386946.1 hypothetical protein [Pseudooceanicola endophyticus]
MALNVLASNIKRVVALIDIRGLMRAIPAPAAPGFGIAPALYGGVMVVDLSFGTECAVLCITSSITAFTTARIHPPYPDAAGLPDSDPPCALPLAPADRFAGGSG